MATIRLTADANQAKRELDNIKRKVRDIGKEAKKPIRPNVQGVGGTGIAITPGRAIGGVLSGAGSTVGKVGGAMGLKAAGAVGQGIGAMGGLAAGAAMGGAVTALAAAGVALAASIGDFKGTVESFKKGAEALMDPQSVMRERAGNMDTLADQARANGATVAEQFAADEARKNVFGSINAGAYDKIAQAIQSALAGDDKTGTALHNLGFSSASFEGKSVLQQQDEVIKAIADKWAEIAAISDPSRRTREEAALFSETKDLVGARNVSQLRRFAGGWQDYSAQKQMYMEEWDKNVGKTGEASLLAAARIAEIAESLAKLQGFTAPQGSAGYAVEKGDQTLQAAVAQSKIFEDLRTGKDEYMQRILRDPAYTQARESANAPQPPAQAAQESEVETANRTDKVAQRTADAIAECLEAYGIEKKNTATQTLQQKAVTSSATSSPAATQKISVNVQKDTALNSTMQAVERNTSRGNTLMETLTNRLLEQQNSDSTSSTATYS